nr:retrovirus-related Pol polyprotein from transposon TNT 1-94 [Tanacetum cinerariifolium]
DEEEVSSDDNNIGEVKVLMALAKYNDVVSKEGVRNGEWVKISMRKVHTLLEIEDNDDRKNYLDYLCIDLNYVAEQRSNLMSKHRDRVQELNTWKEQLLVLKQAKLDFLTMQHCISEQILTQKKKILRVDQLTKDPSTSEKKDLVFVKSSADDTKVSIRGVERPFRRFLNNKLEYGERMWNSIQNGPYERPMIPNPENTQKMILEPLSKMTEGNKRQYIADVKVMKYLFQAIPNDIYNSVDSKYVTMVRHNQTGDTVSYDVLYDSLVQFEPHVLASKAKKAAKNHDQLALLVHSNASSSQSHANSSYSPQPYYVTHPSSIVDYEDEYQGELQDDSQEDKLTTSMMLLARAITQKFSTPTNTRLHTSSNTRNQVVFQDGRVYIRTKNTCYRGNADYNAETVPSYDVKAVNEVNASSKVHEQIIYKMGQSIQTIHMLGKKPNKVYDPFLKDGLGYQNPERLKKAIAAQPKMYDGEMLHSATLKIDSPNSKETLKDAEEKSSAEQTYFSIPSTSNNSSETKEVTLGLSILKMPKESKLLKMFDTLGEQINGLRTSIDNTLLEDKKRRWMSDSQNSLREFYKTDVIPMSSSLSKNLKELKEELIEEVQEMLNIFESMEQKVHGKSLKENILQKEIDRLLKISLTSEIQNCLLISAEKQINELLTAQLEKSLKRENVKVKYQNLFNSIKATRTQHQKELDELIEHVNQKTYAYANVRAQNQDLLITISELKNKLKTVEKGNNVNTKFNKFETLRTLLYVTPLPKNIVVKAKKVSNSKVNTDRSKPVTSHPTPKNEQSQTQNENVLARGMYRITRTETHTSDSKTNINVSNSTGVESSNSVRRPKSKDIKSRNSLKNTNAKSSTAHVRKMSRSASVDSNKHEIMHSNVCQSNAIVLSTKTVNAVNDSSDIVCVSCGTVCFGNDHFTAITGYGDYVQSNLKICHVYYVEGLRHNLFLVGQFCDGDLEVAFRSNTCYIWNLEGDDLLIVSRDFNLYTISIFEMAASSLNTMRRVHQKCQIIPLQILDNENTSSSSSIIVEEYEAPQTVSPSIEQVAIIPIFPLLNENADELVQEDITEFDGNVFYNAPQTTMFKEAESSSTF